MSEMRPALAEWKSIVPLVHGLLEGRREADLDRRAGRSSFSVRETVHHIAEANVVAASIMIAALGSPGAVYDWSWMLPFGAWLERLRYGEKPVAPSLRLLEALNEYVVAQVEPLPDGLERRVLLRDQPGGELREITVAEVLLQEADHAREHVAEHQRPSEEQRG
jgi:hypothetical protein